MADERVGLEKGKGKNDLPGWPHELGAPRQRPFGPRLLFVQTPHSHSEPQSPRSVHAASDELKWLTKYGQSEAITSHSHNSCSRGGSVLQPPSAQPQPCVIRPPATSSQASQ